ncbi:FAD:protein FMN transferase [Sphingomonas sp. PR090111-T3T-6A]|uniref:FAD:protein FMN transferase n=1 Tax=Sphingomonas sp. PR090111-T3T-6A TaxID=685778 RepID=UPI00036A8E13|nr:FAD:protein FMN transferase [Sphingomonas sp. PR090111-T3T-6A]
MRIALPPAISAQAFAGRDAAAPVAALAGETMGTTWSVRFARPPHVDPQALRASIVARLGGLVGEMSHWEAGSLLAWFNRAAAGQWIVLPPDFAQVMAEGLAIAGRSGGAFDPAIGRIVNLWGFGPVAAPRPPSDDEIDAARALAGWQRLAYDAPARRLRQPGGVMLDLSGIAKGHAVDVLADLLEASGVRHALVEIGGELAGRGVRPDGDPWWVDLEVPPGLDVPPLRIALHGLAVATSGDYRRGAHSLDPRTGRPITHGTVSVSVLHDTALRADAWATALTVFAPDEAMTLAAREGIAARLLIVADGETRELVTPALAAMLED